MSKLPTIDLLVLLAYLAGTVGLGCWFATGRRDMHWMTVSPTGVWPARLDAWRSPFHIFTITVVATLTILLVGLEVTWVFARRGSGVCRGAFPVALPSADPFHCPIEEPSR